MTPREKFERFVQRHPHRHDRIFERPHWTRRHFFQLAGAGVTGSWLAARAQTSPVINQGQVEMIGKAKSTIFILLAGAPSHVDTFDYKKGPDTPEDLLKPESMNGVVWPMGLLPKLGQALPSFAIVRSMRAWALVHGLAQTWSQIGRNPAAVLGDIAPNIGSIVAIEKEAERRPGQVFPTFLALNSASGAGPGYLPTQYSPFRVAPAQAGLTNTAAPDDATGQGRYAQRTALLDSLDGSLRKSAPYGRAMQNMDAFYQAARGMAYDPAVNSAFSFTAAESAAYGGSAFGNACLVARKVLAADQGTRFVQITLGSWDHHQQIYADANLPRMTKMLDDGLSQLLAELSSSGLLNETLVVMAGEFGRTVGPLSGAGGRDHWLQQFAMLAGAGVTGGKVLGSTTETGAQTVEYGWSREREVKPEDLEATIYSAMGINWTTVRYDDPFGRGFFYVPYSDSDVYGPLNELWT